MITVEIIRCLSTFLGALTGNLLVWWWIRRSDLRKENERLRAWIDKQAQPSELGPHRSAPITSLNLVHERDLVPAKSIYPLECGRCGALLRSPTEHNHHHVSSHCKGRPPRPAPTTVPSGGRLID